MSDPTVALLAELGRDHRACIREQVAFTNMLKARARDYVGRDALLATPAAEGEIDGSEGSDGSEKLSRAKCEAAYRLLLRDREDPAFLVRVARLLEPRDAAVADQARLAREMGRAAKRLPVWTFAESVRGLGAPMLGKLVAEAPGRETHGFLDFDGPAKLWARFGLAVVDGAAPRRAIGKVLGHSPYRRSVAWQMGDSLLRANLRRGEDGISCAIGPWGELYLKRKDLERQKAGLAGLEVLPAAKIKKLHLGDDAAISEGRIHLMAKRWVEKRLVRELWRAWRDADIDKG